MKLLSVPFALITVLTLVSGCSTVTEKDLADLKSPNVIVKEQAIGKMARGQGFPLRLMTGFASNANEEKAVAVMVTLLRSGEEPKNTRLSIIRALGELGKRWEAPVDALVERLEDEDPLTRTQVIEALGKTKNKKALTALLKLLRENKDNYAIIWALGEIGDQRAVPALNGLLSSENKCVRYNAYRALARMGAPQPEENGSSTTGVFDIGRTVFRKYRDIMVIVFQRLAGRNTA